MTSSALPSARTFATSANRRAAGASFFAAAGVRAAKRFDLDFGLDFGVDLAVEAVLALAVDVVSGLELAM